MREAEHEQERVRERVRKYGWEDDVSLLPAIQAVHQVTGGGTAAASDTTTRIVQYAAAARHSRRLHHVA